MSHEKETYTTEAYMHYVDTNTTHTGTPEQHWNLQPVQCISRAPDKDSQRPVESKENVKRVGCDHKQDEAAV